MAGIASVIAVAAAAQSTGPPLVWPNKAPAAVSLAYDDALDSQLDIAVPALFHQCSRSAPYRSWVNADNDLDAVGAAQLVTQVRLGNTLLQAPWSTSLFTA